MKGGREFEVDLLAGASAGAVGKLATHPIDTCKSLVQSGNNAATSAVQAFRSTWARGGLAGLYRGIGAVLVGGTPAAMIYLTSYEVTKKYMAENTPFPGPAIHLTGGMLAEAISCVVFVPVDVIKERMQVFQPHEAAVGDARSSMVYKSSLHSLTSIVRSEGLMGIYKGYGATLLSFGPYSALYFMGYEYIRAQVAERVNKSVEDLAFGEVLACSAAAGSVASYVTTPLDLVKLRMQLIGGAGGLRPKMVAMLRDIYASEGAAGLFRGSMARVGAFTPTVAISMAVFESCKKIWSNVLG